MDQVLVGQIFGVLTTLAVIVTNLMPKRWQIMLGSAVTNILATANLLLVGAGLTVCMVNIVAVIHSLLNTYKSKKGLTSPLAEKIIFSAIYFLGWGFGFYLSLKAGSASWLDIMPLIATAFFVGTMLFVKEQRIRLCILGNSSVYTVYHIIFKNSLFLATFFNFASALVALVRYREKKRGS